MNKTICTIMTIAILFTFISFSNDVSAEGESGNLSMVLSRSVLNIDKTFTLTVYIRPNININIYGFDLSILFDESKITPVIEGDILKYQKTTSVPSKFNVAASIQNNEIVIQGLDMSDAQNTPIIASGNTAVVVIYFKVKSDAAVGQNATFSFIPELTSFTISSGDNVVPLALEEFAPQSAQIGPKLDTNTNLSRLSPNAGVLTPAFSKSVTQYTVNVPDGQNSIAFTAAAESAKASVKTSGGSSLNFGKNTVTVTVTAEDTEVAKTYTITVNRASPPTPTPEDPTPTEEISDESSEESSEVSSDASSEISQDPTPELSSESQPIDGSDEPGPWKTAAIIFAIIAVLTTGTSIWLILDKVRNRDKIVKVRRID